MLEAAPALVTPPLSPHPAGVMDHVGHLRHANSHLLHTLLSWGIAGSIAVVALWPVIRDQFRRIFPKV